MGVTCKIIFYCWVWSGVIIAADGLGVWPCNIRSHCLFE